MLSRTQHEVDKEVYSKDDQNSRRSRPGGDKESRRSPRTGTGRCPRFRPKTGGGMGNGTSPSTSEGEPITSFLIKYRQLDAKDGPSAEPKKSDYPPTRRTETDGLFESDEIPPWSER